MRRRRILATSIATIVCAGLTALLSAPAQAYPGLVAHGYTTCKACHYNPLGNGPLTDYGRALGATVVSMKPFWIKKAGEEGDEKTTEQSGFLGSVQLPSWIRPAFDYRGLGLYPKIQDSLDTRWIDMQLEASVTVPVKKFVASFTYGKVPIPSTASPADRNLYPTWLTREHYVGYQGKTFSVYAGLLDPAHGLRIPEHNAYIRSLTSRNINDQNHSLLVHVGGKKWDLYVNPVVGNFQQSADLRQKGVITTFEYDVIEHARAGISLWNTKNTFKDRKMGSLFTRVGLGKGGAGLLGEFTLIRDAFTSSPDTAIWRQVSFLQATSVLRRGLYLLFTFENSVNNLKAQSGRQLRAGPTLQWFPVQRLEFRTDLLTTRSLGSQYLVPDDYSLLAQVHVWL